MDHGTANPGWYPDSTGAMRWWDGTAWTEHVAPAAPGAPLERPRIADDAPVDGAWIWVAALVGFVSVPFVFLFDWRGYLEASMRLDTGGMMGQLSYLLLLDGIGLALSALIIVASYWDWKRLRQLGVVRPFHWAFAFLGVIVYLIGRHVVLRKVTRTPGWPLWVNVALQVVCLIAMIVWLFWFMAVLSEVINSQVSMYR